MGLRLLHLVVAPEHEHHERRGGVGALEQFGHGGLARRVVAVVLQRGGQEREAHLRQRREEFLLRLLLVLGHEERHEAGHLARGQVARGGEVARVGPEVGAGLRGDGVVQLEFGEAGREARVERVVDLPRALERKGEAVGDLLASGLVEVLELAGPHELAHGREDGLRVGLQLERREPAVSIRLSRRLQDERLGAARGDLHELVLAQVGAGAFPEGLPVRRLHETVLRAELLQTRDGHVAEAAEHRLHELAGLLLEHLLHAVGIALRRHEDVALGGQHERLARGVERKLVAAARAEVDRDAAVEGVKPLDFAQTPGGVEHERAGLEGEQAAEAGDGVPERTRAEADGLDESGDEPVLRGLLQGVAHGLAPRLRLQVGLELVHQAERGAEVLRLGKRLERRQDPLVLLRPRRVRDQVEDLVHGIGRLLHDFRKPRLFFLIALLVHEPLALLFWVKNAGDSLPFSATVRNVPRILFFRLPRRTKRDTIYGHKEKKDAKH